MINAIIGNTDYIEDVNTLQRQKSKYIRIEDNNQNEENNQQTPKKENKK